MGAWTSPTNTSTTLSFLNLVPKFPAQYSTSWPHTDTQTSFSLSRSNSRDISSSSPFSGHTQLSPVSTILSPCERVMPYLSANWGAVPYTRQVNRRRWGFLGALNFNYFLFCTWLATNSTSSPSTMTFHSPCSFALSTPHPPSTANSARPLSVYPAPVATTISFGRTA